MLVAEDRQLGLLPIHLEAKPPVADVGLHAAGRGLHLHRLPVLRRLDLHFQAQVFVLRKILQAHKPMPLLRRQRALRVALEEFILLGSILSQFTHVVSIFAQAAAGDGGLSKCT